MTWFARDHTGRPLSDREREFLAALAGMLDEVHPPQLIPGETALTAEGSECLIVLLPHRALGGVSIVVWLHANRGAVPWAQVGGLGCCHDSLDAGLWIAEFPLHPTAPNFGPMVACVHEQLHRPILLRVYGASATVLVRNSKGQLRTVGTVGAHVPWFRQLFRGIPEEEAEVRFTDEVVPSVSEPSGVAQWFTSGH